MAFGLTLCLLVVFVKGCVGNNNTTFWNSGISSTALYGLARTPSVTLVRLSTSSIHVNTSTLLLSTATSPKGSSAISSVRLSSLIRTSVSTANGIGTRNFVNGSFLTPSSSAQFRVLSKNTSFESSSVWANSSFDLNASSTALIINHHKSSTVQLSSSKVVPPQGPNKHKEDHPKRERLLPGQLAGVALILFILVVLLLIICLGNFADEPVFDERELFTEEISMENVGSVKDTRGQQEDEEWKFDPLFAWSPRKSFDSKL